jgi:predicted nucleic acid-binding protein
MEIVIDTNIIIAALLKEGLTRKIIFLSPLDMCTVPHAKSEIEEQREELLNKSKLDIESFKSLTDVIFMKINVVPLDVFEPCKEKAIEIMRDIDIDDSPFLALAMALNCSIWSNDGHFKKQDVVNVYTTNKILNFLKL